MKMEGKSVFGGVAMGRLSIYKKSLQRWMTNI